MCVYVCRMCVYVCRMCVCRMCVYMFVGCVCMFVGCVCVGCVCILHVSCLHVYACVGARANTKRIILTPFFRLGMMMRSNELCVSLWSCHRSSASLTSRHHGNNSPPFASQNLYPLGTAVWRRRKRRSDSLSKSTHFAASPS